MTTRQSTTLHMSDESDDRNGLAFSTVSENYPTPESGNNAVLEIWGTIFAPDGQPLNAKMEVPLPDVRDLQSFLNDEYSRSKEPKAGADAALQTQIDGANAQYFKDGWMASLRELLEMGKVRGYDEAITWAKNQLGAYVGPAALSSDALPGMWDQSDLSGGATDSQPRQCPHISNGVQCTFLEGHVEEHYFAAPPQHQPDVDLFQEQAGAINATPQDLSDNPRSVQHPDNADLRNEAEKSRSRRLKVEMTFDKALDAHKAAPSDETWAALVEALKAVEKKEPDNSRVRRGLASLQNTAAEPTATEAAQVTQPAEPGPTFAPEQQPAYQPIPNNGYDPSLHAAEEQFEQQAAQAPATPPTYQQTSPNTGLPQPVAALDPASQQAAAAFPCVARHSQTGAQCQRPAGHDIETPQRPPTPHMFATDPATLGQDFAPAGTINDQYLPEGQPAPTMPPTYTPPAAPAQGFPSTPPAQAGGQPMPVAHLHAVPNQPLALHEGEPGMTTAPAMPTWQAPQS